MDEEAEGFVTEMENEGEVNANDQVGGQDEESYVVEGQDVNEDEDEDVVEL